MYLEMREHCSKVLDSLKEKYDDSSLSQLIKNPNEKEILDNRPVIWDQIFSPNSEAFDVLDQFYFDILKEVYEESLGSYTISVAYKTGDSFNSYNRENEIPLVFKSLREVNSFLEILIEHHFYHFTRSHPLLKGKKLKDFTEMIVSKEWYNKQYDHCFIYNNQNVHAFWEGYFEFLEEIIVLDKNQNIVKYQYVSLLKNPFQEWIE